MGSKEKRATAFIGLVVLACAAIAVLAIALLRPVEPPQATATFNPEALVIPTTSSSSAPEQVKIADVLPRLGEADRPFTFVVLGDSTGSPRDGWVAMVGKWMGQEFDRPVTLNPWSEGVKPAGYLKPITVHDGSNAEVTIFNASAPSQDGGYSLEHLDEMIPVGVEPVDLILINHGHNEGPGELESHGIKLMAETSKKYPNAATVIIAQNPERTNTAHATIQAEGVNAYKHRAMLWGFDVIDVNSYLAAVPNFDSMLEDNVHPTIDGYRLWADKVIADLSAHMR